MDLLRSVMTNARNNKASPDNQTGQVEVRDSCPAVVQGAATQVARRSVVATIGGGALFASIVCSSVASDGEPTAQHDSQWTAERWMDVWMKDARLPVGQLYLGRFADPIYFLRQPISWEPEAGEEKYEAVHVPVGFVTDLASIPRVFWSLLRPDGNYAFAAIVHDYLYWGQTRPRRECDTILKLGMQEFSIAGSTVDTIFGAVRLGGGGAWSANARLRKSGEKRMLKRFPEDPRITWNAWKANAGNLGEL